MRFSTLMLLPALLLPCAAAHAQHAGDVVLFLENNTIMTGVETSSRSGSIDPWRVWAEDFGELAPNFSDEPGFDSVAGTFTPGAAVGVAIRKALRIWDADEEHFDTIPELERIEITRFQLSIQTPPRDPKPGEPLPSLQLGLASGGGIIHAHPWYEITAPHGTGVYLLELEVWTSTPGIERSDPFWIVFNQNDTEENHDAAVDWVMKNLAGPPTCDGDLNTDGTVDVLDLLILLGAWGKNPGHAADLNGDGTVDVLDLLVLLGAWGECP